MGRDKFVQHFVLENKKKCYLQDLDVDVKILIHPILQQGTGGQVTVNTLCTLTVREVTFSQEALS